jgi:hypothetical protein
LQEIECGLQISFSVYGKIGDIYVPFVISKACYSFCCFFLISCTSGGGSDSNVSPNIQSDKPLYDIQVNEEDGFQNVPVDHDKQLVVTFTNNSLEPIIVYNNPQILGNSLIKITDADAVNKCYKNTNIPSGKSCTINLTYSPTSNRNTDTSGVFGVKIEFHKVSDTTSITRTKSLFYSTTSNFNDSLILSVEGSLDNVEMNSEKSIEIKLDNKTEYTFKDISLANIDNLPDGMTIEKNNTNQSCNAKLICDLGTVKYTPTSFAKGNITLSVSNKPSIKPLTISYSSGSVDAKATLSLGDNKNLDFNTAYTNFTINYQECNEKSGALNMVTIKNTGNTKLYNIRFNNNDSSIFDNWWFKTLNYWDIEYNTSGNNPWEFLGEHPIYPNFMTLSNSNPQTDNGDYEQCSGKSLEIDGTCKFPLRMNPCLTNPWIAGSSQERSSNASGTVHFKYWVDYIDETGNARTINGAESIPYSWTNN